MSWSFRIKRLMYALNIKGFFPKIKYFFQELILMTTKIRPKGIQKIKVKFKNKYITLNYYDFLFSWWYEIIDQKNYDIKLPKNPFIIDIGANQGFSVLWFKLNYPKAKIDAYEPSKKSYNVMVKNIQDNKLTDCFLINAGVFHKNTTSYIFSQKGNAGLSNSIIPSNENNLEKEEIRLINIDPIYENMKNIDLIKIDIEGSEYFILKYCNFWKKANNIIIEFHDKIKEKLKFKNIDFIKLIEKEGFILDKKIGEYPTYICHFKKQKVYK